MLNLIHQLTRNGGDFECECVDIEIRLILYPKKNDQMTIRMDRMIRVATTGDAIEMGKFGEYSEVVHCVTGSLDSVV